MKNRDAMVMRELGLAPVFRRRGQADGSGEAGDTIPAPNDQSDILDVPAPIAARDKRAIEIAESPRSETSPAIERRSVILQMDWPDLKAAVAGCEACKLHTTRSRTVFGVGDENASWLFVGEGPGAEEDKQGEPFVGQAGKLLDNMLGAIDLRRGDDVYIANIVKCRPPGNRNPESDEATTCEPYLMRQIQLIKPRLIVALGKVAVQNLLGTDAAVGSLRSRLHDFKGIPLIVTYHPAYLLRNPADKVRVWEDLCFARATMANLKTVVAAP